MRATEVFYSIQGEALHCGIPSIFVRLFACNLRCESFGLPKGEKTTEVDEIFRNIDSYKTHDDLPLVRTGCDSYVASDSRFKRFAQEYTPQEMATKIKSLLPKSMDGKFYKDGKSVHVVFTGGEPLLWQKDIADVLKILVKDQLHEITFETNGTLRLQEVLADTMKNYGFSVTFSISPKLSASGEPYEKAIVPDAIWTYYQFIKLTEYNFLSSMYLKFVVAEESDLEEVEQIRRDYYGHIEDDLITYLMPAGGCYEEYSPLAPKVAQWAMDEGYRFSPRLHITLFKNNWGT